MDPTMVYPPIGAFDNLQARLEALHTQYQRSWRLDNVEVRIAICRAVLSHVAWFPDLSVGGDASASATVCTGVLPAEASPSEPYMLQLAQALDDRYKHTSNTEDLEAQIKICQLALASELCTSQRVGFLCLLGSALRARYQRFGSTVDLEQALHHHQVALNTHQGPNAEHSWFLSELGISCAAHYGEHGVLQMLEMAITYQQDALRYRSVGDVYRYQSLFYLGTDLWTRFTTLGKPEDLETSIALLQEALSLCPVGHRDRHNPLNSLGISYYRLYRDKGDTTHLSLAITQYRQALQLHQAEHRVERPKWLINLATALRMQASHLGAPQALDEAIDLARQALALCHPGHYLHQHVSNDLAVALRDRYLLKRDIRDLEEGITRQREVLEINTRFPRRHLTLHDFAVNLRLHSQATQDASSHGQAMIIQQEAIGLLPKDHPDRAYCLFGLARLNLTATSITNNPATALQQCSDAVTNPYRSAHLRLADAVDFLDELEVILQGGICTNDTRSVALQVYREAIGLLPRVTIVGAQAKLRLQLLAKAEGLAVNASIHALYLEKLRAAVEVLEEGRAMFWTQHLRLRTSFDALPRGLSDQLRDAAHGIESHQSSSVESGSASMRQLHANFEALLQEARTLPGFARFMLHGTFDTLSAAADRGPVVVLIPGTLMCHALIICKPNTAPLHVDLTISKERLSKICDALRTFGRCRRDFSHDTAERSTKIERVDPSNAKTILKELWKSVVKPIIKVLNLQPAFGRDRKRLWWCPTGIFAFLPIHAAGTFQPNGQKELCCSDYAVSSYTPTVSALLNARDGHKPIPHAEALLLLAAVPKPFQGKPLDGVVPELQAIQQAVGVLQQKEFFGLGCKMPMIIENATATDVLRALSKVSILHLACHGEQDARDALNSGFAMRDCRLRVADLLALDLRGAFLAFLSACETARGDDRQPDQAIHLAATMIFVGFRSVVGTMWSMHDADGPEVACVFYRELFKGGSDHLNPDDVAYALDTAVTHLRHKGLPPSRWAPYIHLGI